VVRGLPFPAVICAVVLLSAADPLARASRQPSFANQKESKDFRADAIRHAQVWFPSDVSSKDIARGPDKPGSFQLGETVPCEYVAKKFPGRTPKFACRIDPDDELKVKYGWANGEVFAEVAATRLLWALGFPTDTMYSVKVICHGCPETMAGIRKPGGDLLVDPAAVERKFPGHDIGTAGWSWSELDSVSEEEGGAPRAHRDALKLLAAFIQHTDSKAEQQRLVCVDRPDGPPSPAGHGGHIVGSGEKAAGPCAHPLMMIADLGKTFGRASRSNADAPSSMNLRAWSQMPVWKSDGACVANLPKSFSGTLKDPVISEPGRAFLSDLLMQLSDRQLQDLFMVARVHLRARSPDEGRSGFPSTQEWVDAFKAKRAEIAQRSCA
jgi:hypothetical protein